MASSAHQKVMVNLSITSTTFLIFFFLHIIMNFCFGFPHFRLPNNIKMDIQGTLSSLPSEEAHLFTLDIPKDP